MSGANAADSPTVELRAPGVASVRVCFGMVILVLSRSMAAEGSLVFSSRSGSPEATGGTCVRPAAWRAGGAAIRSSVFSSLSLWHKCAIVWVQADSCIWRDDMTSSIAATSASFRWRDRRALRRFFSFRMSLLSLPARFASATAFSCSWIAFPSA